MKNTIIFENLGLTFNVNEVAFNIFGIDIYCYGIIIVFGIILAFLYASREVQKEGISQDDFLNMFIICVPCAIICARLYYVIFNFSTYKDNLLEIFNLRGGGIAIYGGIIGTVSAILIYSKIKKISFWKIMDILAVGLLIGQCIGRWGNFVNGEAFGSATENIFAMTVLSNGVEIAKNVHPTFLYESMWNLLSLIILLVLKKKRAFFGETFCRYLILYGFGRFFIEGLRADSLYIANFRVSQVLSLILFVFGIAFIIFKRIQSKKEPK